MTHLYKYNMEATSSKYGTIQVSPADVPLVCIVDATNKDAIYNRNTDNEETTTFTEATNNGKKTIIMWTQVFSIYNKCMMVCFATFVIIYVISIISLIVGLIAYVNNLNNVVSIVVIIFNVDIACFFFILIATWIYSYFAMCINIS